MRDKGRPTTQLIQTLRSQDHESGTELVRQEFFALARILVLVLLVMVLTIFLCK
jgi:hypothetical protein